ncbi:MAG: sigma-54-dependent Fis family transcriptional regulator, partial [Gemmatimonadales bacterium]
MREKPILLLIDDELGLVESLTVLLEDEGFEVVSELSGAGGVSRFKEVSPDIVLSDVRMPKTSGIEVLEEIRRTAPEVPVVLMTAQASLQSAIQAVNLGATHYVQKPFQNEELVAILRRSLDWGRLKKENTGLKRELNKQQALNIGRPIGVSPAFEIALRLIENVADSESTILLSGESGTGKEIIARYIHDLSSRSTRRLLSLNCGALPEGLLESELFGHVKGSFTGAVKDKEGLFVAASGGTFFMDEVGELSASTQVKLLRVLQQREVIPVGSTESVPVDVRLIAATNIDLE